MKLTGHPVRTDYKLLGQPDVLPPPDAILVCLAGCTGRRGGEAEGPQRDRTQARVGTSRACPPWPVMTYRRYAYWKFAADLLSPAL